MGGQGFGSLCAHSKLRFCSECRGFCDIADDHRMLPGIVLDDWHSTGISGFAWLEHAGLAELRFLTSVLPPKWVVVGG